MLSYAVHVYLLFFSQLVIIFVVFSVDVMQP